MRSRKLATSVRPMDTLSSCTVRWYLLCMNSRWRTTSPPTIIAACSTNKTHLGWVRIMACGCVRRAGSNPPNPSHLEYKEKDLRLRDADLIGRVVLDAPRLPVGELQRVVDVQRALTHAREPALGVAVGQRQEHPSRLGRAERLRALRRHVPCSAHTVKSASGVHEFCYWLFTPGPRAPLSPSSAALQRRFLDSKTLRLRGFAAPSTFMNTL
jgi:hypothetical protein